MKKVTIIGCGWLGLALGKTLREAGFSVAGSVRSKEKLKSLAQVGIEGFVLDLAADGYLPETQALSSEVLIFALPPFDRKHPERYGQAIGAVIAQCPQVNHVIFVSSSGVYPQRSGEYTEEFSFLENEKKANVLYAAEQELAKSKVPHKTILRPSGLFGPGRHPAISLAGRQDVANPSGHVNLVHQKDVIQAILLCMEQPEKSNEVFNLAYPDHPWRKPFYTKLYRKYGLKAIGFETSSTVDRIIAGDKIVQTLGFHYQHPIDNLQDVLANNL